MMTPQIDHACAASFFLWIDHYLLEQGRGFTNVTGQLFSVDPSGYQGYNIYASSNKQWVYDSSISGAAIPSGVYVNNNFVPRGTSGLQLDYENGRVFFNSPTSFSNISGVYSEKDVNVYFATESDERILFETKYSDRSLIGIQPFGLPGDTKTFPALFVKYDVGKNYPFEFGGLQGSNPQVRCILLANNYLFHGVTSILKRSLYKYFIMLPEGLLPFNYLGDLKSGSFNYNQTVAPLNSSEMIVCIKDVTISKFNEEINSKIAPGVIGGIIDFTLEYVR